MAASVSESWQPVPLGAEFSPEVATLLSTSHPAALESLVRGRNEPLRTKLKKHLLALGWTIVSRPNAGLAPRLRYDAPDDGKRFYSLPNLIHSGKLIHVRAPNDVAATDDDDDDDNDDDQDYTLPSTDDDESMDDYIAEPAEEKRCGADAIAEYVDFVMAKTRGQGPRAEQLRVKAKEQLVSSGWTFWMTVKYDGRQELRYKAPHGRSYISLVTACKAYQQMTKRATTTPTTPRKSKPRSNKRRTEHAARPAPTVLRVQRPTTGDGNNCTNGSSQDSNTDDVCSNESTSTSECARSKNKRRVSAVYADDDTLILKKKKKKSSASPARVLRPRPKDGESRALLPSACQLRARTLLSVLMDRNIIAPKDRLTYKRTRDGPPVKEGLITGDGIIKCMCGCNKAAFTVAEFEVHAGRSSTDRPWARMFLKDGRSLSQCLLRLMGDNHINNNASSASLRVRLKKRCSDLDVDSVCSACHGCGELLLCDHCPSAFHHACVGLDVTPEGDWFCPSCRCSICDSSDFDPDASRFTDKTVMYCDQCEREYHVGCIRNAGDEHNYCPEGPWLCSEDCSKIFQRLQGLVDKSIPTSIEGLSFTILRSSGAHDRGEHDEEAMAEQHGRLCVAFDVLHECFVTLIEPLTQSDLSADIIFNRESELRRLNFRGFYMIGLEKGGELITVGTLRVYGKKVAELPLVGTRFAHRRQGMCHLLMNELEKLLSRLGVERLVLPAVPELVQTWTGSFGFKVMSQSDKLEIAEHTILSFHGTSMCHKFINNAPDG